MTAENGAAAIALYAAYRDQIDVVLTDMAMPVMDGPATIVALRTLNPRIRVIGSSGLASNGGLAKVARAGLKHFVPKPYTAEILLTILAKAIHEKEPFEKGCQ